MYQPGYLTELKTDMTLLAKKKIFQREIRLWLLLLCFFILKFKKTVETSLKLSTKSINKRCLVIILLILLTAIISAPIFITYEGLSFEQILMFLVLPFTLEVNVKGVATKHLFLGSSLSLIIFMFIHIYSLFYLGFCFAILFFLAHSKFKPTLLSMVLILITMPAIKYILSMGSFPFRLWLTKVGGHFLSFIIKDVVIEGNNILADGINFSVAPECLGINLLTSGMVCAIFGLGLYFIKEGKRVLVAPIVITIFLSVIFVVIANLSRIVITVVLKAMPDTILHELIGILIFFINCCIPLLFLIRIASKSTKLTRRKEKPNRSCLAKEQLKIKPFYLVIWSLLFFSFIIHENKIQQKSTTPKFELKGFTRELTKDGVLKYTNDSILIYLKPPKSFIGAVHNPFICWRGCGYTIQNEKIQEIGNKKVRFFELQKKGQPLLYSCYWFDNGNSQTADLIEWRLDVLTGGQPYWIINITSHSKEYIIRQVKAFDFSEIKTNIEKKKYNLQ